SSTNRSPGAPPPRTRDARCRRSPAGPSCARRRACAAASANAERNASEFLQQAPESGDLVRDPVLAQRMPVGRRVDGNDRLAQPQPRGAGATSHAEMGADLNDAVDIVAVERDQLLA